MTDETTRDDARLKRTIRARYAERATSASRASATQAQPCACGCSSGSAAAQPQDELARGLYSIDETSALPDSAVLASLGCGNPTALADLHPGEVVLDLGSGGGIDVLLSARRVGPTGKVYGLDMTDEMLALARENQRRADVDNVEFLKGEIEDVPLPDASVDVVISNCVINLSPDKDRVLAEAYRVLKPGGRFAVSDVVFQGDLSLVPDDLRQDAEAWAACVAGALEESDYLARLRRAGFVDAAVEVTGVSENASDDSCCAPSDASCCGPADSCCSTPSLPDGVRLVSAFVRAVKPGE